MTSQKFFTDRNIIFGILLIIGLGILGYRTYFETTQNTEVLPQPISENTEPPTFTWKYDKADTLNLDGIPNTNVFLEATYDSGATERKLIATTPGGCNDLPDPEKDSVPNSAISQCYSAGLGYRFKITKGESSYLIKRKTFEEASPDYNPPASDYEVVSEFPLTK